MNPFNRNKVLSHWEQIKKYKEFGETSHPITVELSLTNKCNHNCPACSGLRNNTGENVSIDYDAASTIIWQLANAGVCAIIFTGGGDPCTYRGYDSLIKIANKNSLEVGLITNGGMIKESHIENLSYCEWIRISLDAATPETYKKMHGVDTFDRTINNIKMLAKNKSNTTIGIGLLTSEETEREIIAFAKLSSELGVDYCQYRPVHNLKYKESINNQIAYAKEYYEREDFKVLFSEFKFNTLRGCETARNYNRCHAANFVTHIAANACVYMCCHCVNEKTLLGNLREKSFTYIWSNKKKIIDNYDITNCLSLCRNDNSNRDLEMITNNTNITHKNFL